jgi:hypothetical protein
VKNPVKLVLFQGTWAPAVSRLRLRRTSYVGGIVRRVAHLGRLQRPKAKAAMAGFLASDHARNITGQS